MAETVGGTSVRQVGTDALEHRDHNRADVQEEDGINELET
jgi:hypothetical protein